MGDICVRHCHHCVFHSAITQHWLELCIFHSHRRGVAQRRALTLFITSMASMEVIFFPQAHRGVASRGLTLPLPSNLAQNQRPVTYSRTYPMSHGWSGHVGVEVRVRVTNTRRGSYTPSLRVVKVTTALFGISNSTKVGIHFDGSERDLHRSGGQLQ